MNTRLTKRQTEIEENIGRPDEVDLHPLITCAPHILGGHAHLKNRKITVERVLTALMAERKSAPITLSNGIVVTEEEVRAIYRYAIDIFDNISKLYAELGRLREVLPQENHK